MGSIALGAALLVGTGWCGDRPLDKTGTSPTKTGCINEKPLEIQGFSEAHSFDTEREGFEASKTGFASHCPDADLAWESLKSQCFTVKPSFSHIVLGFGRDGQFCPQFVPSFFGA